MSKLIILTLISLTVLFGKVNPLLEKGASITDISNKNKTKYIEVPFERISYTPSVHFVNNMLIYSERLITQDTCLIDYKNTESCPIDKKECSVEKEYTQGSSTKEEGYMSCSKLNPSSYYDSNKAKCVLPSDKAQVCKSYVDSYYDSNKDKCVTGNQYRADAVSSTVTRQWWNCDSCGVMPVETFLPVVKAAGGTYIKTSGTYTINISSNPYMPVNRTFYKVVHDAKVPFKIWVQGGKVLTIQPREYFGLAYKTLANKDNVLSTSSINKPYLYASVTAITYPCKTGYTPFLINDEHWCTNEEFFTPSCSHNINFPERDSDICLGDKKKYTYYNYTCPSDSNVYGNVWQIIDPGGDCGENNLITDTDNDGINDQCNNPLPDTKNCERVNYRCSFNPDAVCVLDEKIEDYNDFTKWIVYNWDNQDTYTSGTRTLPSSDWEVLDKSSVIQHVNGMPTYFLSNYEMQDGLITIEGTFKTDDPWDNDWFGFVFGMKDETHYYLLDWSRWKNDNYNKVLDGEYINRDDNGNPINGAIPLTLAKVNGLTSRSPLWSHMDSGTVYKVLQRKDNGGWTSGQEYKIRLEISRNDIKAWIGKVGEPLKLDIDYHSDVALDITGKLGFYNYSISKVTYKDFRIEWNDGEDITKVTKRILINPADWIGEYKNSEYGVLRNGYCPDSHGQCMNALSSIEAMANKLCLTNKNGEFGCFEAQGSCLFNGLIKDTGMLKKPIFAFLNNPDEVVSKYHSKIKIDYDSPTNISLDFEDLGDSSYDIGQIKTTAYKGNKITIDFWMYWRGDSNGMPIGFDRYDLWISNYENKLAFGFNTAQGDLYGIDNIDYLKNSWHRITAIFTQGDILQNQLYIDGVKQTLSEQHLTRTYHENKNADITKPLQLSGWRANDNYALDAKIAGVNIYDGELSEQEVASLVTGGDFAGISRLEINPHSIVGYDANNTFLGEINSTCRLSGKVGTFGRFVELPKDNNLTKKYYDYILTLPYEVNTTNSCQEQDITMEFDINTKNEILSAILSETKFNDWIAVWVNNKLINVGPYGGDRLVQLWTASGKYYETQSECTNDQMFSSNCSLSDYVRYEDSKQKECELGTDWVQKHNIDIFPYLQQGRNTIRIKTIGQKDIGVGITFKFNSLENNIHCTSGCTFFNADPTITPTEPEMVQKLMGSPITSAKIIQNRIEFWNSYENRGNSGFIEVMKEVAPQDKEAGYLYEFRELDNLYDLGFTAFKSVDNITYATSVKPMDIAKCQQLLDGTHYFLAERNISDKLGIDMINSLSYYIDGAFGEYCIIEKRGEFDNLHAEYSVKEENIKNTHVSYFCSPWSCKRHMCGYAQCQDGSFGNMIMEVDKPLLNADTCIDDKCDINKEYFRYCGNPNGCATNDVTITQTDDGKCKKAECNSGDLFNPETGACEKIDCKYLKMDGKCFKKVY